MSVSVLNRVLPRGPMQGPLVWIRSKASGDNIVVLTSTELVIGTQWSWKVRETANAVSSGKSISELLGKDATYIPLFSITSVTAIVGRSNLTVTFDRGTARKASRTAPFESCSVRDQALASIQERLGPHVESETRKRSRLEGGFAPLVSFTLLAIAAAVFYHLASAVFGITPTNPTVNPAAMQAWYASPWDHLAATSPMSELGVAGVFAGALTATMLGIFGYMTSGVLLLTGAAFSLCLAVNRIVAPATTITIRALAAT